MLHLRPVVVTVLLGLLMTMTQAPVNAVEYIDAPAPQATPAAPMAGEFFSLEGQIPGELRPDVQRVFLWRLESGKWVRRADVASTDGSYAFSAQISATTSFRVTAYTTSGTVVSATRSVSVAPQFAFASVKRVCGSDNQCGSQAEVTGYVRPVREGRAVNLQLMTSDGWKFFTTPIRDTTDGSGNFQMTFNIGSWSQWNARQLRAVAASYRGAGYVVSAPISFMPGPTTLGRNVLRVDVAGGAFPQTKGVDYTGAATLSRDGEVLINRASLDKFGVRGHSTAGYPKKPYNLRFRVPPTVPVFGMPTHRSWTLLAMYVDQSFVREKTVLDLGRKLDGMTWNPDSEYVELFLNSEYMGAYLMTEKVQIDAGRVAVGKDTGMIMETDNPRAEDPRKEFKTAVGGLVFAFKDPDGFGGPAGITSGKLSAIRSKLATVEWYLYSSSRRSYYRNHIDRDSAADFHLAQEFFKDAEGDFWRSRYFSWDARNTACGNELCDGKLHFGPLWDFDHSAGLVDATYPGTAYIRSYRGWVANGTGVAQAGHVTYLTHWFAQLWKVPSFRTYLAYRWNDSGLSQLFWQAANFEVDNNKALIGAGAHNDRRRWAGSAKLYKPKGPTYDDEVRYVKYWLLNRFNWMDSQL